MSSTATPTAAGERPDLKPLVDISKYRLKVPLHEVPSSAPATDKHECMLCRKRFSVGKSLPLNADTSHPRQWYGLCTRHYMNLFYAADPRGRQAIEAKLQRLVPRLYHAAEFNTFKATGPCRDHLAEVRDAVARWTQSVLSGWAQPAVASGAGSIYVYGCPTRSYTGNGCGKTHLAWSAFKHIARWTTKCPKSSDEDAGPVLACDFIDIQDIATEFLMRRADADGGRPNYNYKEWDGVGRSGSFDDYLANLASAPVLFVDDIGQGRYTDRYGNPTVAGTTFETIVNARAQNMLPTLYTSNYAPADLGQQTGSRAASRIFRGQCVTVAVQAPDYAMAQCAQPVVGGFRLSH